MNFTDAMKTRMIRGGIVTAAAVAAFAGAAFADGTTGQDPESQTALHGEAGVTAVLSAMETDVAVVQADGNTAEEVGASDTGSSDPAALSDQNDAAEADAAAAEETASEWAARLMPADSITDYVNVRTEPSAEAALAGKLRRGNVAEIVSAQDGWYQITSGSLSGYISSEYVVTGDAAEALSAQLNPDVASVTVDALRVRSEADENASIVTTAYAGSDLTVRAADAGDGWTAVSTDAGDGFVKTEYVTISSVLPTGITAEEEAAAIAAQKAAEEAAAKAAAEKAAAAQARQTSEAATAQAASSSNQTVNFSADDQTLIAAIIQLEAGNQPYDGQVAVGAVIMNRVKSGRFPSTVQGVVFQSGQFYPSSSPRLARVLANGPSATCMQAAADAMAGADPTGGCLSFRSASTGHAGLQIGYQIFF